MTYSSCLNNVSSRLVLDASVLINLLAWETASDVLRALGMPMMVPEQVLREVELGESNGRRPECTVSRLAEGGAIETCALTEKELETFAELVSGSASESLGDGEAATIAMALSRSGYAVIDERKATRMCETRFRSLPLATTVDLFSHARVSEALGPRLLRQTVLSALTDARMQIRDYQFEWVAEVVGGDTAAQCPTLRRFAIRREKAGLAQRGTQK